MGRPVNADAARTRQRILDAGLDLFSERGFYGTTMRQIGASAGVTGSALYHHFESKEAILHTIVADVSAFAGEQFEALKKGPPLTGVPLAVVLERLSARILEVMETPLHRKMFRLFNNDGTRLLADGVIQAGDLGGVPRVQLGAVLQRLMEEGTMRRMPLEPAILMIIGPLLAFRNAHLVLGYSAAVPRERTAFLETYVATLARGLAP